MVWRGSICDIMVFDFVMVDVGVEFKFYYDVSRRAIGLRERFETVATLFLGLD